MMHLDKTLTRTISKESKHKIREKFKLLAKDILKDVEDLFSRPNLHQKIKFELLDVKIIRNDSQKVLMNENVSKYLKSYCEWQGEKKVAKKRWYYSVLFTGLDLFYLDKEGAEVRSSTGKLLEARQEDNFCLFCLSTVQFLEWRELHMLRVC